MPRSPSWIDPEKWALHLGDDSDADPSGEASRWASTYRPSESPHSTAPMEPKDTRSPLLSELPVEHLSDLEVRCRLFVRWMQTLVGDRPFFVADAEGMTLIAERVASDRVLAGPILERAIRVLRPFVGSSRARGAHVELEDGQLVQVVWRRTERGRVALGIFGSPLLDPERVVWLGRALERVFVKGSTP